MLKKYVCNRYPKLKVSREAWFEDGFFQTDSKEVQGIIEGSDSWKSGTISYQDPDEVIAAESASQEAEKMQGGFKSGPEQDATRKLAKKMDLDEKETEQMVKARGKLAKQVQEAMNARKRGVPTKEQANV